MTREINVSVRCLWLMICSAVGIFGARYETTNEIISNELYRIAGNGDTLWMLTSHGLNYTTALKAQSVQWRGVKNIRGFTVAPGNHGALIFMEPKDEFVNDLTMVTAAGQQQSITFPFNIAAFQKVSLSFKFYATDAVWFKGFFWIACSDAGLIRYSPLDNTMIVFRPGIDKKAFAAASFTPQNLNPDETFPDPRAHVVSVAHDSTHLWIAAKKALWSFSIDDTLWTPVVDTMINVSEYLHITVSSAFDSSKAFVSLIRNNNALLDTNLYAYNLNTMRWNKFITQRPDAIALGADKHVYVLSGNSVTAYRDTLADSTLDPNTAYVTSAHIDFSSFKERILSSDTVNSSFTINDICYTMSGAQAIFCIATDQGLFYSTNEHEDQKNNIPFKHEYRKVALAAGLKKIYAVPGIINTFFPKAVFAYNLSENDHVTIDIFDYNMDHVVQIIRDGFRKAGSGKTSGRSTDPQYDYWNGTVNNTEYGRIVSPGVYYFRITTRKGKRAFGKVIVARN